VAAPASTAQTPHGSGLGVHRWVVQQSIALPHRFRRLRIRWKICDDIHKRSWPSPAPSSAIADSPHDHSVRSSKDVTLEMPRHGVKGGLNRIIEYQAHG